MLFSYRCVGRVGTCLSHEAGDEDARADEDESAEGLGPASEAPADPAAKADADGGEPARYDADDYAGRPDGDLHEGHAQPDSEGVEAGGDRSRGPAVTGRNILTRSIPMPSMRG